MEVKKMAVGVLMPKAGITVEECVITEWLKKKGDHVSVGDILFTYETDKASFECESTAEGELLEIFYEDGDEVPVLTNVCAIGQPGDDISGLRGGSAEASAPSPVSAAEPAAAPAAAPAPAPAAASGVRMAQTVIMPKAGITVEECVISEWLKKKGDHVSVGDVLFTYETDKASFECESTAEGELLEIFYQDGDEVPVLVPVCAIGQPGDCVEGLKDGTAAATPAEALAAAAPASVAASAPASSGPTAQTVIMPKAGITVEECVISEWLKKKGDHVSVGDVLFTYETDKASFECESTAEGELLEIFYQDGDEVPVLAPVCAVGQPGDSIEGLKDGTAAAAPAAAAPAAAAAPVQAAPAASGPANPDAKVSPRARKTAKELGVDATAAAGTGPHGRIVEADVKAYAASAPAQAAPAAQAVPAPAQPQASVAAASEPAAAVPAAEAEYVDVKFSGVRKATAKGMTKSLSTMAQLTNCHSFDATAILALRKQLKANAEAMGMPNITLNDMILFAVSRVIQNHPDLNATMPEENVLRRYKHVNLGMAVDTPKGLFVPTIFHADEMSLAEISVEAKRVAKLCQEGKATPDLLAGATFTISNVGSLGVEMFTPIINPPQVGILGVCGTITRIKEVGGEIKPYQAMPLCLTYDHRAVDGSPASRFMKELCNALENFPLLMMK